MDPSLAPATIRALAPQVLAILVRRGADFAAAEDAVQEALVEAWRSWPDDPPRDPKSWLVTVAWRRHLDAARSEISRRQREERVDAEPEPGPATPSDDSLQLYFLCAHPSLTPSSAVALTLRAVGGLATRQIAAAYLVPEATMAQRIPPRTSSWEVPPAAQNARSRACVSTSPATWAPCSARSTWSSTRDTPATSTWRPRRSA